MNSNYGYFHGKFLDLVGWVIKKNNQWHNLTRESQWFIVSVVMVIFVALFMVWGISILYRAHEYRTTPRYPIVYGFDLYGIDKDKIVEAKEEVMKVKDKILYIPRKIEHLYRVNHEYVNIRQDPTTDSEIKGNVIKDAIIPVEIISDDKLWAYSDEYKGWMYLPSLLSIPDEDVVGYNFMVKNGDSEVITDLTIYNGTHLKINDHTYIPMDEIEWAIIPGTKMQIKQMRERMVENRELSRKVAVRNQDLSDIRNQSYMNRDEIYSLLAGTDLEEITDAVLEIEDEYGINPLYTISISAHESAWGSSYLSQYKNNLFGIGAPVANPGAAYSFASKSDCVRYWGKMIKENYIDKGLTTTEAINTKYAEDQGWSDKVDSMMYNLRDKL